MLVGAVDFGGFIFQKMEVQNASRAGAQFAIQAAGNSSDTTLIEAAVRAASDLDTSTTVDSDTFCGCADGAESTPDTTLGCSGDCAGGEFPALTVRVTVSGTFTSMFPYPGIDQTLTITGVTVMQVP
jgi:Flp pilus assembly protein TadG